MPHLTLTQSKNITHDAKSFFIHAHQLLTDRLPTQMKSCQSRVVLADDYLVADGSSADGFAYLEIAILAGRSSILLKEISKEIYQLLEEHLLAQSVLTQIKISVEIRNLNEVYYSK